MDKMKMHTPNLVDENIDKIAQLFPNCITESRDEEGNLKRAIDFDQLRQELSDSIVEGPQERYRLDWPGKKEAMLLANAPIAKTLRPSRKYSDGKDDSINFDTTENLFIEGDNLDALKLLQETYLGKVKVIYIDPPYNTGNDFIYEDDFTEDLDEYFKRSHQKDEEGNRLVANTDTNGRFHSDWLSMIYSRLKLARNLLEDGGAIFISVDDCEVANIRKLCEEIFGVDNFVAEFVWKSRQNKDNRNTTGASIDHEYVICFSKFNLTKTLRGAVRNTSQYSNPDNDYRGDWASGNMVGLLPQDQRPNCHYDLVNPATGINYGKPKMGWRYDQKTMSKLISEDRILWPADPSGRPRRKVFLNELSDQYTGFSSVIGTDIYTRNGTAEIEMLFDTRYFDFPKPSKLIKDIIEQVAANEDIVLDFFAGSSTTAHAVMQLNSEDGGNRKFIMVQIPEECDEKSEAYKAGYKNIAEISKERIRRAGKKILEGECHEGWNKDIGFRVLKVDSSNMEEVYYSPDKVEQTTLSLMQENIKSERSPEDLLFQVMLDWGVELSLPIEKQEVCRTEVFYVDDNALAACFDDEGRVSNELVEEIAKRQPLRVVFRDASFKDDSIKNNVESMFKLLSPNTKVKTI